MSDVIGEQRLEFHLIEDLCLEVVTFGDFDESETFSRKLKDGTFGDIKHLLTMSEGGRPVETNVLNLAHELRLALRLKSAAKNESPSALSDVQKAADTRETIRETRDIHAALGIHLHRAEHGDVEPAAIIEIELRWLVDDGLREVAASKV